MGKYNLGKIWTLNLRMKSLHYFGHTVALDTGMCKFAQDLAF